MVVTLTVYKVANMNGKSQFHFVVMENASDNRETPGLKDIQRIK